MVFISYSSKEYILADNIRKKLLRDGVCCWMAPESIPAGGDYSDGIPNAIENCDVFLLILSNASQSSKWVPKELDLAITHGKKVIPFHIDDSVITNRFLFRLVDVQRIETECGFDNAYRSLLDCIMQFECLAPADTVKSELPKVYSYYDMLDITSGRELDIRTLRKKSDVTRSLAVPIGINEDGEIVMLDLHQRGDGPNGLIIGPVGSGKSEFLLTLFLSLGLHFAPDEVSLHMTDFKGGGIVSALKGLPHLGICLTECKDEAVDTFYTYFVEEISRRNELLEQNAVSNIYQYLKLRKNNPALPAMPHIVIAFDEFADIKRMYPDLAYALKEWGSEMNATLLGIHLVYATQRYAGVIDDSIYRLADYKICSTLQKDEYRVYHWNEDKSRCPGRFYFQSPFQERIQLIQLAYSEMNINKREGVKAYSSDYGWFFGNRHQRETLIFQINRIEMD